MVYLVRRFFSIYIDGIVVFILTNVFDIIGQLLSGTEISKVQTPDLNNMLIISIYILYFCLAEFFLNRTLGKKLLKFEIIGFEESKSITRLKQILIRNLIRLIPIEPFSIFLNEEHRMWHDMASKTTVVDARKKK